MSAVKKLKKGEVVFREGDAPDAMYIVKSGRIAITKNKGNSDIVLAELKPGEMLGEMAFFDSKPRSAGARAESEAEVITLPFQALHAQFKTFPEWLKSMVKTINSHLRDANMRIKNLESASDDSAEMFPPHTITRLCAIITLVGYKAGEKTPSGLVIPSGLLRSTTIQIFQQPTHKMQKMMEALSGLGYMKIEDLGEGKQKIIILKHQELSDFVDWYNQYLFTEESKRVTVSAKELPILKALVYYGRKAPLAAKSSNEETTISLTDMQNNSMKDLGYLVSSGDADSLAEKGLVQEKQSAAGGQVTSRFQLAELERLLPFWELVHALRRIPGR